MCLTGACLKLRVHTKNTFLISQPKHIVGTQKNRLIEAFLLSTKTFVKNDGYKNIYNFMLKNCVYNLNLSGSLYFQKFNRHQSTSLFIWSDWIQHKKAEFVLLFLYLIHSSRREERVHNYAKFLAVYFQIL